MHLLFAVSVFFTILSTGFLTLIFENKKIYNAFCIYGGILFSQVIFTYECLSLFSLIKPIFVISFNFLFLVISTIFYKKYGKKPDFQEDYFKEKRKIKFAIQKDKYLKYCIIAFFIYIIGSLIYMYFMPPNDEDALSYHIARLPFWYETHNINHFECSDIRALLMPINSEIFYFWAYSFIKSDIFVRLFSFLSYLMFVSGLRGFFKELKIPVNISLWVILSVTAMQSVLFAVSGTETNITIAALMISTLFLFAEGIKEQKNIYLFFSAMMYALAVGTKTPALQAAPALFIILLSISYFPHKKFNIKPLIYFSGFFAVNFLLFSSYNYILNYIDFGNPISSANNIELHRMYGGIKGFVANIVRYIFMMFDLSGLPFSVQFWRIKTAISELVLALLNIPPDIGIITSEEKYFKLGNNYENMCGLGILGTIFFIPALIIAVRRIKHSSKSLILGFTAIGFVINVIILSLTLGYMIFSIRFMMFFVMFASPILCYIFIKNKNRIFKKILTVFLIYIFTFSYYFYERRFSPYLCHIFYQSKSIENFKKNCLCANVNFENPSQACEIIEAIKEPDKNINVLYFANSGTNIYYAKNAENNNNFNVDFRLLETAEENNIDWQKYDYIIVPNIQSITYIKDINKYKNAIIDYSDGYDGRTPFYDFDPKLFANCIYGSSRRSNFQWLKVDEKLITTCDCFFKHDIFVKHGFEFVRKYNNYLKEYKEQLNLYKKINK